MFSPEDRSGFDQTWSQGINDHHTSPSAMVSGKVVKHNGDGTFRVAVESFGNNLLIGVVRRATGGVVGPGTGQIDIPALNSEIKLNNNQGKTYGFTNNYVSLGNVFSTDFPHPTHPSLYDPQTKQLKLGTYGYQGGVTVDGKTTPATVQFHDTEGGYHDLTMGKRTDRRFGPVDSSTDGLAVTPDDISGIKAGAGLSTASEKLAAVGTIDPTNSGQLGALAQRLSSVSTDLGLSAISVENGARSFSDTVVKQAEALAIASWSSDGAYGDSEPDDLV
jgi:hypothetical protein